MGCGDGGGGGDGACYVHATMMDFVSDIER